MKYYILLLMLLLIPSMVYAADFDNSKEFIDDGHYGKIVIKNAFGLGSVLAEWTLEENTDTCFLDCLAQGTLVLNDADKLFDGLNFHNTNGDNIAVQYDFQLMQNGQWKTYPGNTLQPDTYEWRILGRKDPRTSADWIINTMGLDLDDWAWWNAACSTRQSITPNADTSFELSEINHAYDYPVVTHLNRSNGDTEEQIITHFYNTSKLFYIAENYTNGDVFGYLYECDDTLSNHSKIFTHFDDFEGGYNGSIFSASTGSTDNSTTTSYSGLWSESFTNGDAFLTAGQLNQNYTMSFWINVSGSSHALGKQESSGDRSGIITEIADCTGDAVKYLDSANAQQCSSIAGASLNEWNLVQIVSNVTDVFYFFNRTAMETRGASVNPSAPFRLGHQSGSSSGTGYIDRIIINNMGSEAAYLNYYEYWPQTTLTLGASEASSVLTTLNQTIIPTSPYTDDDLNCSFNVMGSSDADLFYSLNWYSNVSGVVQTGSASNLANNSFHSNTLDSSLTSKGIQYTCGVIVSNSTSTSTEVNVSVSVLNTPPTKPSIVSPEDNFFTTGNVTLSCSNSTDIDGDTIYYEFWGDQSDPPTTLLTNSTSTSYSWDALSPGNNYWSCRASDLTDNSTSTDTRTIIAINFTDCSGAADEVLAINFTNLVENNETMIPGTLETTFFTWRDNPSYKTEFHLEKVHDGSVGFCISPANETIYADANIQYVSDTFDVREYYIRNSTLNNQTQNISLYSLEIILGSPIVFHVTDESDEPLTDVIMYVQRLDVGQNTFKTMAMGLTDTFGEENIFLRKEDAFYRFVLQQNLNVIFTSSQVKITDDDVYIRVPPVTYANNLAKYDDITYSLNFDQGAGLYTLIYTQDAGLITNGCLQVTKTKNFEKKTLCDQCVSSASATIQCYTDNDTASYRALFYVQASPDYPIFERLDDLNEKIAATIGLFGPFITGIFIIGLSLTAAFNVVLAFVLVLLSLGAASIIGIIPMQASAFVFIAAMIIIVLIRRGKQ